MSSAESLLADAERLTADLLSACEAGTATVEQILSALDTRERLLQQLDSGSVPSADSRAAADRLRTLDARLMRALHGRTNAVKSELAKARRRTITPQRIPGRLVVESA